MSDQASAVKKLLPGEYLFREGDKAHSMYVIKSGELEILKETADNNTSFKLAELRAGSLVGEMALFDSKPRSASVRATRTTEIIVLPYESIHKKIKDFPEWAKAILKTLSDHIRSANQRIRELENITNIDRGAFSNDQINRLMALLGLVIHRFARAENSKNLELPQSILRKMTIQVFGEPTARMDLLVAQLEKIDILKTKKNEESGALTLEIFDPNFCFGFVDWFTNWIFSKASERFELDSKEVKVSEGLTFFGKKVLSENPDSKLEDGRIKIDLVEIQNDSMRYTGDVIRISDFNSLIQKKIISDIRMEGQKQIVDFDLEKVTRLSTYWKIILNLRKMKT